MVRIRKEEACGGCQFTDRVQGQRRGHILKTPNSHQNEARRVAFDTRVPFSAKGDLLILDPN